ncbi:hypothetical protein C8J57DRAFT_1503678 [Mycena rebaudengoi]|nr:hypothetical protein C8J57DRAFT_1503678 [Mycena rebaudengoi]
MIGFQQLKYDIYNATTECFVLDTASYTKRLHRDLPCALMLPPSRPSPNDLRCTVPQFDSRGSRRAPTPPRLTLTPSAPRTPLPTISSATPRPSAVPSVPMHEYPVSTHIHDTRAGARVNFSYRARHPPAPISAILTRLHQQQIVRHGKRVADDDIARVGHMHDVAIARVVFFRYASSTSTTVLPPSAPTHAVHPFIGLCPTAGSTPNRIARALPQSSDLTGA